MERTLRRMARKRGLCAVQKARLARIHTVKTQYCSAFIHSKMKAQQRLLALEVGSTDQRLEAFNDEDLFQLQHHHLLSCLERTTVCSPLSLSLSLSVYVSLSVCLIVTVSLFTVLKSVTPTHFIMPSWSHMRNKIVSKCFWKYFGQVSMHALK